MQLLGWLAILAQTNGQNEIHQQLFRQIQKTRKIKKIPSLQLLTFYQLNNLDLAAVQKIFPYGINVQKNTSFGPDTLVDKTRPSN